MKSKNDFGTPNWLKIGKAFLSHINKKYVFYAFL